MMKLEQELTMPPPGTTIKKDDPIWSAEAEMAQFKSASKK